MAYYTAGDYGQRGGYYAGYYSAGGLGSWLKSAGKTLVKNLPSYVQFGRSLVSGNIPGAISAVQDVARGLHPSQASGPGHAAQGVASGGRGGLVGMMASHQQTPMPVGTPGHQAQAHAAGAYLPSAGRRRRPAGRRRTYRARRSYGRRRGGGRRRSRRRPAGDARVEGGRWGPEGRVPMSYPHSGHYHPPKRRRGTGGKVSFTTKDGRKVSFTAKGDA